MICADDHDFQIIVGNKFADITSIDKLDCWDIENFLKFYRKMKDKNYNIMDVPKFSLVGSSMMLVVLTKSHKVLTSKRPRVVIC